MTRQDRATSPLVMNLLSLLALGFFLGMRHATDPDHVVAVATIVARERNLRAAGLIGALWGLGHTLTIFLVGGAIILFGLVLPARLGLSLEFSVAVMLVLLGSLNIATFRRDFRTGAAPHHSHEPYDMHDPHGTHDSGSSDTHAHDKSPSSPPSFPSSQDSRGSRVDTLHQWRMSSFRPLFIGIVHGLAGSAAVALMVLATIREPYWAMLYLSLFGVGTVAGMMLITTAMAAPLVLTTRRFSSLHRHLGWVSGLLSVGFGLFLVYEIGVVDGLFTSHPHWDPR